MMRSWLALGLLTLGAGVLGADDFATLPKSAPPEMAVVHEVDAQTGALVLFHVLSKPVYETYTVAVKVVENGEEKTKTEQRVRCRFVCEMKLQKWTGGKAWGADGKALTAADLARQLRKGDIVLTTQAESVEPVWLKPLKADTILLQVETSAVPRRMPAPGGPSPFPPPVAKPTPPPQP